MEESREGWIAIFPCQWGEGGSGESLMITWWEENNVFISFNSGDWTATPGVQWVLCSGVQWQPPQRGTLSGWLESERDTSWHRTDQTEPRNSQQARSLEINISISHLPFLSRVPACILSDSDSEIETRKMCPDWLVLYFSLLASFTHSYSGAGWLNYTK